MGMCRSALLASCATFSMISGSAAFAQSASSAPGSDTATPPAAPAATAAPRPAASASTDINDIVVTARRRSESIQTVPVSVQAFTPATLQRQVILSTTDLQRVTPGVVFSGAGNGTLNTTFSIRGQGRDVIGPVSPSVMSYFNEVPLPNWGAVLPTYDVENVQVLKGPQGTLFGRNTTGGAVLVYSKAPTYNIEGYGSALYGSYDWKELEGAVNVPIIDQHLAIRIAGAYRMRDGYTKSPQGYSAGDDLNTRSFRISLLAEPFDGLKNVTVYDFTRVSGVGSTLHPTGFPVGTGPNGETATFRLFGPAFDCGTSPSCDYDLALIRSKANPRKYWASDGEPFTHGTIQGLTNTTTLDLGDVTVKNIFGFRKARIRINSDGGGTEMVGVDSKVRRSDDQYTDELQVSGTLLGGSLNWLAGGFYLRNKPDGPNSIANDILRPAGAPYATWFINSLGEDTVEENSRALFLSLSQNLGSLVEGLKLNVSGRYTWDRINSCAAVRPVTATPAQSFSDCEDLPGASNDQAKFKKFTWSVGLDYQAARNLFLYAVSRRGYRAGGVNTPTFGGIFTPFQTFGPQTITDGEIGFKADWTVGGIRGRTNVSGYIGKFNSLQRPLTGLPPGADGDGDPSDDPSNTTFIVNAGDAKIRGIDVDGFISPFRGFQINYGAALFHGKLNLSAPGVLTGLVSTDPKFDNAPSKSYTIGATYTVPSKVLGGDLSFSIDHYYLSKYKVGLYPFPSHNNTNASIGIQDIESTGIDVQVFVQNLTKELYPENTLLSGLSPGILTASLSAPRMFGLKIRYNFDGK